MQPFILKEEKMNRLEENIGYHFKNKDLIKEALTHTSYSNEKRRSQSKNKNSKNNERLEFLGDSVLSLAVTSFLFERLGNFTEGDLSRLRSTIVCEKSLKKAADTFDLGQAIYLGKGEEQTGGRQRESIIADAMEALIGAIYLDAGFEEANRFILKHMGPIIELAIQGKLFMDYKTQFQEFAQQQSDTTIEYKVIGESGPDHNKTFRVVLLLNQKQIAIGEGRSKKEAEQNAAKGALGIEE